MICKNKNKKIKVLALSVLAAITSKMENYAIHVVT